MAKFLLFIIMIIILVISISSCTRIESSQNGIQLASREFKNSPHGLMVDFTVSLDVPSMRSPTYRSFIEGLRTRLAHTYSHNRPVLPPQNTPPTNWFDMVLQIQSTQITLRIRRDNLYLDGYLMTNGWLEFGRAPSPHLIPGSTFLGFDGNYDSLERAANRLRGDINLGRNNLVTAVNILSTSTDGQERARQLIVVIQMICESIRFINISDHLANTLDQNLPAPTWMQFLENGWGTLSDALLRADITGRFTIDPNNNMNITTAEQAVSVIGILLRSNEFPIINDGLLMSFLRKIFWQAWRDQSEGNLE